MSWGELVLGNTITSRVSLQFLLQALIQSPPLRLELLGQADMFSSSRSRLYLIVY